MKFRIVRSWLGHQINVAFQSAIFGKIGYNDFLDTPPSKHHDSEATINDHWAPTSWT